MRYRNLLILAIVIALIAGVVAIRMLSSTEKRGEDPDGDGRWQRATWSGADEAGLPTTLSLFIGTTDRAWESYDVRIEVPGEGLIGNFGGTAPDFFDGFEDLVTGESPVLRWDLSNRPADTRFQIRTRYLDANSRALDVETITTSRDGRSP